MQTLKFPIEFKDGGFVDIKDDVNYSIAQSILIQSKINRGSMPYNRGVGVYNYLELLRDHTVNTFTPAQLIAVFESEAVLGRNERRPDSIYVDLSTVDGSDIVDVTIEYNYNQQKSVVGLK
jgi:hypothetical protein